MQDNSTRLSDLAKGPLKFVVPEPRLPNIVVCNPSREADGDMRTKSELTLLKEKRRRGEALAPAERELVRADNARYYRRKVGLHLSAAEEEQYHLLAAAKGMKFSPWAKQQLRISLAGPSPREKQLAEENQALRDELRVLRGSNGQLSVDNSRLQQRLEAIEANLMEATAQALRLNGMVNA